MSAVVRGTTLAAQVVRVLASNEGQTAVEPPGHGDGFWAGAPSAVWADGGYWLAYRLRRPVHLGRGYANVVARSSDGVHFRTVTTVTSEQFGAASLERPALVPLDDGTLRLYVSCSTWDSKHWWVEAIGLADGARDVVLPGDAATAWKDPVIRREVDSSGAAWHMWACRHPLDGGEDEADRMDTRYATSTDGLRWSFDDDGAALAPTPGSWDARGVRVCSVLPSEGGWVAFYDGRASAAENWHERTGAAFGSTRGRFVADTGPTPAGRTARYLSVAQPPGGMRLFWEAGRPDGAHEVRTAYLPQPVSHGRP